MPAHHEKAGFRSRLFSLDMAVNWKVLREQVIRPRWGETELVALSGDDKV